MQTREHLKWADGKIIKEEVDAQIAALLGPRIAADNEPVKVRVARACRHSWAR